MPNDFELETLTINIDPRGLDVIEWIQARLESLDVEGNPPFKKAFISDNVDQILKAVDSLQGDVCAIIPDTPHYANPSNAAQLYVGSMKLSILAVHFDARDAGDTPSDAVFALVKLGEIVREAMMADRSVGGLCSDINFTGRKIDGIDFDGEPMRIGADDEKSFYAVAIPFIVGWQKLK